MPDTAGTERIDSIIEKLLAAVSALRLHHLPTPPPQPFHRPPPKFGPTARLQKLRRSHPLRAALAARQEARQHGAAVDRRDRVHHHRGEEGADLAARAPRARGADPDLRRHPRPVPRPAAHVRVLRLSARRQLPLPRRLRRPREERPRVHLPPLRVQDQVPGELLPAARQPRVRVDQPDLRLLRRVQEAIQHQDVEEVPGRLQRPPARRRRRREDLLHPRRPGARRRRRRPGRLRPRPTRRASPRRAAAPRSPRAPSPRSRACSRPTCSR
jgi:hypothetical protein